MFHAQVYKTREITFYGEKRLILLQGAAQPNGT